MEAVSPNAFHNSDDRADPPKCHENTRVAVISKIMDWVTSTVDTDALMLWLCSPAAAPETEASMLWLYGPAGAERPPSPEESQNSAKPRDSSLPVSSSFDQTQNAIQSNHWSPISPTALLALSPAPTRSSTSLLRLILSSLHIPLRCSSKSLSSNPSDS